MVYAKLCGGLQYRHAKKQKLEASEANLKDRDTF